MNVYVFYSISICIHGEELLRQFYAPFNKYRNNFTMKQMFEISEKLMAEQSDEIYGVNPINWVILHGNICRQSLARKCLRIFRFCVLLWRDEREPTIKYAWEDRLTWFKSSSEYRALDTIDGEQKEFEWNIFPRIHHIAACVEVQSVCSRLSVQPENLLDGSSSCRFSTTSHGDLKTMNKNANQVLSSFSLYAKRFSAEQWSFLGLDQRKSGILSVKIVHKVNGTKWRSK